MRFLVPFICGHKPTRELMLLIIEEAEEALKGAQCEAVRGAVPGPPVEISKRSPSSPSKRKGGAPLFVKQGESLRKRHKLAWSRLDDRRSGGSVAPCQLQPKDKRGDLIIFANRPHQAAVGRTRRQEAALGGSMPKSPIRGNDHSIKDSAPPCK